MREMKRMGRRRRGGERREISSSSSPFCTLAQERRKRGRERESETERNLLLLSFMRACARLYERRGDEEREGRRFHRPPYLCTWEGGRRKSGDMEMRWKMMGILVACDWKEKRRGREREAD